MHIIHLLIAEQYKVVINHIKYYKVPNMIEKKREMGQVASQGSLIFRGGKNHKKNTFSFR